uniref:Peroxidase n=1 Tax=Oryza barthii TaxID=65489 RepID=A0A0D3GFS1_9ORYZ
MAIARCCVALLLLVVLVAAGSAAAAADQLRVDYYRETCPNVEAIVRDEMEKIIGAAPSLAGPLLRLHFHDCFVRGCDASVLLSSTAGNVAERDAKPNKSLRGFGSVERVKARLEAACPGTVLSGAHTLGTAHCPSYAGRLYNFTGKNDADPSLDGEYAGRLRARCASATDESGMISEMDPGSYKTFDTSYYRHVAKRRGLFSSDASLLTDATTRDYVRRIATGKFDDEFFRDFGESMTKMGNVQVLTGEEGEIRKKCYVINS